jgi:SpoIID/LytB domain protein
VTDLVVRTSLESKSRRVSRRGLAIAASGLLGLLSVSTIVGPAEPSYAQNIVVINGRGFGHGVGLAQDGAYWMGRAGRSATEILRLFFPGTVIAKRGGTVRVPLGGGGSAQLGFPNGGTIGDLRVPAGGSVSVRASGGEVVASVLTGPSSGGDTANTTDSTTPLAAAPNEPNAAAQSLAPQRNQVAAASVTPSGIGTAVVHQQDRSAFVAFSEIRTSAPLGESTLANGNGFPSNTPSVSDQNEIVSAAERFQADTPIVSSVITVPATSSATAPSSAPPSAPPTTPAPTNPAPTVGGNNPGDVASSNPVPTNPTATSPVPTAVTASAATGVTGPDGAIPAAPIVTSVESGAGTGATASVPSTVGSVDATNPETSGATNKPRNGTTQGSSLSASSGGATVAFNGRRYRGSIEFNAGGGSLRITNSVDLEDYLKGMGEILTPSWPSAALQSQAIAARTYALRTMAIDGQVCPTQRCQVYLGAQAEYGKMNSAVDATRGKVLTYGGKLAATFYSASGGGTIATPEEGFGGASSQQPYLKAGSYPTGDVLAWTVRMPLGEVARRVGYGGSPRGVTVTRVGPSGRALEVTVDGSTGPLRVGGPKFDAALGLKSTFFTINEPVFGSTGSDAGSGGLASGPGGSGGSSSDLSSALAALGLSNAVAGAGSEEQSRLLSAADPDFSAGSATTLPPFNLVPSASTGSSSQGSPDFGASSFESTAGSAGSGLVADTTSAPTTTASAPKPTQPDNSAGSTIEAINLPARDSASSGSGDLVFLAVPTALLGLVGIGLRRRIKANSANRSGEGLVLSSPRSANKRPRSTSVATRRPERTNDPDRATRPERPVRRPAARPDRGDRLERPDRSVQAGRVRTDRRPDGSPRRPAPPGTRPRPRPMAGDSSSSRAPDGTRRPPEALDESSRSLPNQ